MVALFDVNPIPVSDFPGKDAVVLHTVGLDAALDVWLEAVLRSGPTDDSGSDAARLLVTVEDLGDAAVGHAQLARDDARTDAGRRQFDDLQTDVVGQRTAIDEHSAQLIHAPLTCYTILTNKIPSTSIYGFKKKKLAPNTI